MGVGDQSHAPGRFTPGKDQVPIVQEAGWAPGPVWMRTQYVNTFKIKGNLNYI